MADLGDILRKHLKWLKALPRVTPFYAVKCNDSRTVLKTLAAIGTGFDCASKVSERPQDSDVILPNGPGVPSGTDQSHVSGAVNADERRGDRGVTASPLLCFLRLLATYSGTPLLFQTEIQLVQSLGVPPERIIYANPCKQVSQIKYAANNGVQMMTFDSEVELMKVARAHPKAK